MFVAGIDIGSRGSKAVIMEDSKMVSFSIRETGPESAKTARYTIDEALKGTGLSLEDIGYVVATGYGRILVPFAQADVSEISCHARGAHWYFPAVRTILDMGGQDCKAINCDEKGRVTNFIMNDKCAGGTGRFLEVIADVLQVPLDEIGSLALEASQEVAFSTVCAVFAKSEALTLARRGVPKSDILAGLHDAIAVRCLNLLKRVEIDKDFTVTGGISKNAGMMEKIKKRVGLEPVLAPDPQIIGALGAALYAQEKAQGLMN